MKAASRILLATALCVALPLGLAACGGGGGGGSTTSSTATAGTSPAGVSTAGGAGASSSGASSTGASSTGASSTGTSSTGSSSSGSSSTGSGGSSSTSPPAVTAANQVALLVEQNPDVSSFVTANMPYVTLSVCDAAGHCDQVDHVLLDTGSTGLRIFAADLPGLSLPTVSTTAGAPAGECASFLSGYMWGPVRQATVEIGGETAQVPIQVVADGSFAPVPKSCSSTNLQGYTSENGTGGLGAKGILGVDVFPTDGQSYYGCNGSSCTSGFVSQQVANVVDGFAADNNGIIITMPSVSASGQASAQGTLTFGVDTRSDNQQAGYSLLQEDISGSIDVTMNGSSYQRSVVDSGSNFYFLNMPSGTPTSGGFLDPAQATTYPTVLSSNVVATQSLSTSIEIDPYRNVSGDAVDPNTGVPFNSPGEQILGMPYFYGRSIAWTYMGKQSLEGSGPLIAFH